MPCHLPINHDMPLRLSVWPKMSRTSASANVELVADEQHFQRVVLEGILTSKVSVDIATADFKAMLVPRPGSRRAPSIVQLFRQLAHAGVEIRLLHSGTPSAA